MSISNTKVSNEKYIVEPIQITRHLGLAQCLYLPAYAAWLLENKLTDLTAKYTWIIRDMKFSGSGSVNALSEEELKEKENIRKVLQYWSQNQLQEYINNAVQSWISHQMSEFSINKFNPEDITRLSLIKRKVLGEFLNFYTRDPDLHIQVMEEIDTVLVELDNQLLRALFELTQDLYKRAQSIAQIGNWVMNLQTNKLSWSDELYRIYEMVPQSEFLPNLSTFNHPDDREMVKEQMSIARTTGNAFDFYYRIILKNGREKFLHAKGEVKTDFTGKPATMIGTLQDVTLQKKNENELIKNEERYHKMTEMVEDYAILLLDKNGIIQNWNKGAEKIKGYKETEIVGKHFSVFYTSEDQDNGKPDRLISTALHEGKANDEGWRVRKDGKRFWGNIVITTLRDSNNEIFGFSKVTRDLTEKKEAERKFMEYAEHLQKKNIEQEQVNKELESFSYIASHDLQEPLRKIKTFSSFIFTKEKDRLDEMSKDYFNRILSATDRMQRLIEDLLDFSKIGATAPIYQSTDLNTTLEEVKLDMSEYIREKNAAIVSSPLPELRVIPLQMLQLFSNIINNAIKYAQPGTPPLIKISADLVPSKNILPDSGKDICYKISFTDNGIGFEQEYAEKIFELFQRLHGKKEYAGTGIGLSICKKIIQNHKGAIKATGELGKGASFNIYLPLN